MSKLKQENFADEWQIYFDVSQSQQKIDSAKTARLQRPISLKIIKAANLIKNGSKLLDVGCGGKNNKYFREDSEEMGFEYYGVDPFNQTQEMNIAAIEKCMDGQTDLSTLNNVLNTIPEESIRNSVLKQCRNALNPETGILVVLTYEGSKLSSELKEEERTGVEIKELTPTKTRDGWQNRKPTEAYVKEVEAVFQNVKYISTLGAKIIVASMNPDLDIDLKKRIKEEKKQK